MTTRVGIKKIQIRYPRLRWLNAGHKLVKDNETSCFGTNVPPQQDLFGGRLYIVYNDTLDGSEIRRSPVEVGSLSHYLQGFMHPR